MASGTFLSLPNELLLHLLDFIQCLEELYALLLTCKRLYLIYSGSSKNILRLAARSSHAFPGLRPHPQLLLALISRKLADWAVQTGERRQALHHALGGGLKSLLDLAVAVVDDGIILDDIREIWRYKNEVLNPISHEVDIHCGSASEMPLTICNEPDTALFTWIIYGELFHHSISAIYDPPRAPIFPLSTATRYKFFVYCVPDINCFRNTVGFPPWFEDYKQTGQDVFQQLSLRVAMREFLHADTWRKALGNLSRCESSVSLGKPGLVAKDDLFVSSVMHLGLRSLQVLRPGGLNAVKDDILTIDVKIRALNESVEACRCRSEWNDWLLESPWITMERDTMVTMYDDTPWEGEDMVHFLAAIR